VYVVRSAFSTPRKKRAFVFVIRSQRRGIGFADWKSFSKPTCGKDCETGLSIRLWSLDIDVSLYPRVYQRNVVKAWKPANSCVDPLSRTASARTGKEKRC